MVLFFARQWTAAHQRPDQFYAMPFPRAELVMIDDDLLFYHHDGHEDPRTTIRTLGNYMCSTKLFFCRDLSVDNAVEYRPEGFVGGVKIIVVDSGISALDWLPSNFFPQPASCPFLSFSKAMAVD